MPNEPAALSVGLVGKRAGAFVAALQSLAYVRTTAVCEPDEGARLALAQRAGVPAAGQFATYDDLLDRARPDVVIVGSPMQLHVPQAIQALERGAHVLSEVTAAVDLEQCRALVQAARHARETSGAQYMMAENSCYRKDVMLVRAMARAGLFGECYFAEGEYLHDVKHLHHFPDGRPTWRATWQVGKRGITYGTHSLGPALEFFGPQARVTHVSCMGTGRHTDPEHPHDDTAIMLCQLNVGGLIKVRVDMMSNRPHATAYYALQGTKGCYEAARGSPSPTQPPGAAAYPQDGLPVDGQWLPWAAGDTPKIWVGENTPDPKGSRAWRSLWDFEEHLPEMWRSATEEAVRAGHGGGDYFVARAFLEAIRTGEPPPIDVYRAMDYTVPGLISEQSIAAGGVPVPVPDLREDPASGSSSVRQESAHA